MEVQRRLHEQLEVCDQMQFMSNSTKILTLIICDDCIHKKFGNAYYIYYILGAKTPPVEN